MSNEIDTQRRLHLHVVRSLLPCLRCGAPGTSLRWTWNGQPYVQCRACLSAFVEQLNRELGAVDTPASASYQEQEEDLYTVQLRPGWFNIHRFQQGTWIYVTATEQHMLKQLIATFRLVSTSQGPQSERFYYRCESERRER